MVTTAKPQLDKLLEAQWAIVGGMLIDPSVVGEVISEVKAEDFTTEHCRKLFEACRKLYFAHEPVDPVTVLNIVGTGYQQMVMDVMRITPTAANWKAYAKILREQATLYRVQNIGAQLSNAVDAEEAAGLMQQLSNILCEKSDVRITSFREGFEEFYKRHSTESSPDYLRWGFSALNDRLYVEPGDVVVLGARPSAGKTMLAGQIAVTMARQSRKRVGIFSFETSDKKLYDRLICHISDVSFDEIKRNKLSPESWVKINDVSAFIDIPLDVIDASGMTVNDIRSISLSRRYDVVVIDYLQLVRVSSKLSRFDAVTSISMALQQFARTSGTTVIELSQLSRPQKAEKKKPPTLEDLRESGQIEQDADVIMLLYAEEPDIPGSDRKLFVAKNKDGELGRLTFGFEPKRMTFTYRSHRTDEPKSKQAARKPAEPAPAPRFYDIPEPLFNTGAREREVQEVFGGSTDNKKNG